MSFLAKARKPEPKAPMITIVGSPGAGKTTLGALFPDPIFITSEDGLAVFESWDAEDQPTVLPQIKCELDALGNVIERPTETLEKMIGELATADHDFKTVVIDSITGLDRLFGEEIIARDGVESVADAAGGFHKGFSVVASWHASLIRALGDLRRERGMAIVFLAHTGVEKRKNSPDSADDYTVYSMDMDKSSTAIYTSESDAVLYLVQETIIGGAETGSKGQTTRYGVARQTGRRSLITSGDGQIGYVHAKERYGMPKQLAVKRGENPILEHIQYFVNGAETTPLPNRSAPRRKAAPKKAVPKKTEPELDRAEVTGYISGLVAAGKWSKRISGSRVRGGLKKYNLSRAEEDAIISEGLIAGYVDQIKPVVEAGEFNEELAGTTMKQMLSSGMSADDIKTALEQTGANVAANEEK